MIRDLLRRMHPGRTVPATRCPSVVESLEDRRLMHAGHDHGTGLLGEYFNNANFTDLKLTRVDSTVNFYWDTASPAPAIHPDTFSVRWTGQLESPKSEAYTLIARTDDGVRLWLDGNLVIDKFTHVTGIRDNTSAPVQLTAGQRYDIKIDYYENTSRAGARLFWSSPTTPREIIPTAALFDGQVQPPPTVPAAPAELYARPASETGIDLDWTDASNNETAFELDRSSNGVDFAPLTTVGEGATTYADEGLAPGTRYHYRVRAVNGAGASAWSNVADATTLAEPEPPPPSGGSIVRVDAAGTTGFTDAAGKFWSPDAFFTGGSANAGTFAVANTADDSLYATRRTGAFSYSRPVESGDYTLRLLFADWYTSAGQRKFNVDVEGSRVLTNFDIVAEAGSKTALVKTFNVTVIDGKLDMAFSKVLNEATLSAFELLPAGPVSAPAAPSGLTATGLAGGKVRLTWQDNSGNEDHFTIERSANGGTTFTPVGTTGIDQNAFDDAGLDPDTTYAYRVRATNAAGGSAYSNTASATPLAGAAAITWSNGKAAPLTRAEAAGAVVDGKLYVIGGFIGGNLQVTTQLDRYDPATNTWATLAPMPAPTTHASTAVDGPTIWVAGFFYNNGVTASRLVYKYNTLTNTWSSGPDLPAARGAGAMAIVGRELHYWGGLTGSTSDAATHWRLDLDNPAAGWALDTPLPEGINHHAGLALNGKLYSIGGMFDKQEASGNQSTVRVYDPATRRWSTARALPSARGHIGPSTFIRNGRILIAGGSGNGIDLMREVVEYDPTTDSWSQLTPLPAGRKSSVAGYLDGKIIVTGGNQPGPSAVTWVGV